MSAHRMRTRRQNARAQRLRGFTWYMMTGASRRFISRGHTVRFVSDADFVVIRPK